MYSSYALVFMIFVVVRGIACIFRLSERTTDVVIACVVIFVVVCTFVGGISLLAKGIHQNQTENTTCKITSATLDERQYRREIQFRLVLGVTYLAEDELLNSTTATDWISGIITSNNTDVFIGKETSCYFYLEDPQKVTLDDEAGVYRIIYTITLVYGCLIFVCVIAYFLEMAYHGRNASDTQPLLQQPPLPIVNGVTLPFSNS